jgi:predicted NBD/HSP70 family sugar kinase
VTTLRKGNRVLIKEINRNLVLNLIKNQGPISRTDLARLSGLSPATVSGITAEFLNNGIVLATGEGESKGGRRPVLLHLNSSAGFVIGLKVMEYVLTSALTDLDAKVLHHCETPIQVTSHPPSPDSILADIIQVIEQTIANSQVERQRVLGIGIGMAGAVDGESGMSRYSPFFNWRNVQIAKPIADHFDLPVYVENDVNALTIAEKWFGYGRGVDHFIVITIGRGIGAGIVVNGQFYRGAGGSAGEVGHIPISIGREVTTLENLASDTAMVRRVEEAIEQGYPTELAKASSLSLHSILDAAESGDGLARQLLADSGRWLGIGIATLINTLNPQLVIIAGEGVEAGEWRFRPMRQAIQQYAFDGLANDVEIYVEPSGDVAWARGAATLVLDELFKSPVLKKEGVSSVA